MARVSIIDSEVIPCTKPLNQHTPQDLLLGRFKVFYSSISKPLCECYQENYNQFIVALLRAYSDHYRVVLTPDIIYITLLQGLAHCIDAETERLRHVFVNHEGQEALVTNLEYYPTTGKDWERLFKLFTDEVEKKNKIKLDYDFSTTTNIEKTVMRVTIMNVFKNYYSYGFTTGCGLPEIYVAGTAADYEKILEMIKLIGEKGELTWWTDRICKIMKYFIRAANKEMIDDDISFWKGLFSKKNRGSGPTCGTGWIFDFFPYLTNRRTGDYKNPRFSTDDPLHYTDISCIPNSVLATPVTHYDLARGENVKLIIYAGFIGVCQESDTYALYPAVGYAIGPGDEEELKKQASKKL